MRWHDHLWTTLLAEVGVGSTEGLLHSLVATPLNVWPGQLTLNGGGEQTSWLLVSGYTVRQPDTDAVQSDCQIIYN